MSFLADYLKEVSAQYRTIRKMIQEFNQRLGTADAQEVRIFVEELRSAQEAVKCSDKHVLTELERSPRSRELPEFRELLEIMETVQAENELVAEKTSGILAVISHEMAHIHQGRSAMNGYFPQQKSSGRLLKDSS